MLPELVQLLPEQFTLYLARHATPDRTQVDVPYAILPGPRLSERGMQEAAELGAFLRRQAVPVIRSSPFERALRTASIASQVAEAEMEVVPALAEWRTDESEIDVLARARLAFHQAAQASLERSIPLALVTHGGPVMILLKALGLPAELVERCRIYDSRNLIPPAGAWRVERLDGELRMELVFAPEGVKTLEGIL